MVGLLTRSLVMTETPKAVKARKATLLATGGFEFNEEMHRQYLKLYPCRGFYGWPFNTGDGHTYGA